MNLYSFLIYNQGHFDKLLCNIIIFLSFLHPVETEDKQ